MSYANGMYEVRIGENVNLTTIGDKADWAPGMVPYTIRGVAVMYRTEPTGSLVLKLDKIPGGGSRGDGDVAVVTGSAADDLGDVLYKKLNVKIVPGDEVIAEVTTASAGATDCHIILLVEPSWDVPENNTRMNASST